jgi:hypothetical protein
MATGTGKTWVLQALLYWQLLNAAHSPPDKRFTRNFLIVAPGLIVYQRLLDAFLGKERQGQRDFGTSDLARFKDLFVPDSYREEVSRFVQSNVCTKEDLGTKVTAGGLIGICNWHALAEGEEIDEPEDTTEAPGITADPQEVAAAVLPLSPGTSAGNSLEVLNRRYERGGTVDYLRNMPSLMVFNDEAHHIHEVRSEGEITEVEWQKSLRAIAETKGSQFVQVDFSATPYNQVGSGQKAKAVYFPHIIADFDLKAAMKAGLVKSLVLDKRRELGALPNEELQFKADRDEHGSPKSGVMRIPVRRFRCCECGKTVSVLPSFVQPYRLVLNVTINEFFGGTLSANALSWLPLLKQYWNRFSDWLPRIDRVIRSVVSRSPPRSDATGWWKVMAATFGDLEKITAALVGRFGVTLFGRYRCHSPCSNRPPTY